jgi:two-component system osmolarity sensor histidine kinase EnvZ
MNIRPRSLFGRTATTIAFTLLVFTITFIGATVYFIVIPAAKRYSDDFAAEIVSAAHSLQSLPLEMHAELQQELLLDHGLIVSQQPSNLARRSSDAPYYPYFQEALTRRAGEELYIYDPGSGPLVWVDVPAHGNIYRLGFNRERLGINPPIVLILVIGVGLILTVLVSLIEVKRVVQPLSRLSAAVKDLSTGRDPDHLPEDGPHEIAALSRAFNTMSSDLQEMAENRAVMIAGISHDLRTPLTRLGIAIEMLDQDAKPEILAAIRRDLDSMNLLIGQFLRFSEGVRGGVAVQVDLWRIIESLAADLARDGTRVCLHRKSPPCVYFTDPVALQRVLENLLRNAVRYGQGEPVDVFLNCNSEAVSIEICDRGPGIPADQVQEVFRPFHRLETARNSKTGGTGLGLAIAQKLANKNNWTIELIPREGGGTIAKLSLPATNRFCLPVSNDREPKSDRDEKLTEPATA